MFYQMNKMFTSSKVTQFIVFTCLLLSQALVASAATLNVSINANPPVLVNSVIEFTAQATGGEGALEYQWDFGDGSALTTYSPDLIATHAYERPGRFTVIVRVRDALGTEKSDSFSQAIYTQATEKKPSRTSSIVYEAAHQRVWNVNPDNNTVTVIDASSNSKLAEISVGTQPRSLAISPSGFVAVVNQRSHSLSIISTAELQVIHTVQLPFASQPYGILFDPAGDFAYVTLMASGKLLKISASTGAIVDTLTLGGTPRHMAMSGDGQTIYVTRFITAPITGEHTASPHPHVNEGGEVNVVNTNDFTLANKVVLQADQRFDTPASARGVPNYLGAPVISPDGLYAWVPSKEDNIFRGILRDGQPLDFEHTLRAVTSKLNLATESEIFDQRIDHNDAGLASAGVFGPNGNYLFIALETSREIAVMDAYTGFQVLRFFVEFAPQGLAVSEDGQRLYVHNFMSRSVTVHDLSRLIQTGAQEVRRLSVIKTVANEVLSAQVLRGKQLFYDALDKRLSKDSYLSCASCHQDEEQDGRVWDMTGFGEGLRNTISLIGRAGVGHGLMHWSANFDEVQDFEEQIRTLAGGTGLMADVDFNHGTRKEPLGDSKAGVSEDLDALAAFLGSLNQFQASPFMLGANTFSNAASSGKGIFINQCASCHGGINFTKSSNFDALENIGSIKSSSGTRLGQSLLALDVPTLRDVWATAPYLHDGSALTLQQAINAHDDIVLSTSAMNDVVAFVKELGSAEADGLQAPGGAMPTIVLNQPLSDSNNVSGSIEAIAHDADGSITKVEFYYNTLLLETLTDAPYVFEWDSVPNGSYPITAKAYDNTGLVANSNAVTVLVDNSGNVAPTVSLQTPQGVTGLASGSIEAVASDADGSIQRVEFYYNGDLIGTFNTAPYVLSWQDVPNGDYALTAKAYDNAGAATTSNEVVVSVSRN